MIDQSPGSWADCLCTPDGKYNALGTHQTKPEAPQLLLRYEPHAAKFVGDAISAIRDKQSWKKKS